MCEYLHVLSRILLLIMSLAGWAASTMKFFLKVDECPDLISWVGLRDSAFKCAELFLENEYISMVLIKKILNACIIVSTYISSKRYSYSILPRAKARVPPIVNINHMWPLIVSYMLFWLLALFSCQFKLYCLFSGWFFWRILKWQRKVQELLLH